MKKEVIISTVVTAVITALIIVAATGIFNTVRKDGLVNFDETGSNDPDASGKKELSAPMKAVLRNSLSAGATLKGFFEVNADDLGEMSDYDLTEFEPKSDEKE